MPPGLRGLFLGSGVLGGVALFLVLGIVFYGMVKYLSIARIGDLPVDRVTNGEPVNFLIVGSDERHADEHDTPGHRSDVVMVARLDPDSGDVSVLSIPRDLVLPIAGTGEEDRINSAYAVSRATLMDTVREEFGIELHHYVEVDFDGFREIVDEVGGVPIWVDAAVRDVHTGLFVDELGCVELDGDQALAFVRSRELEYMTPAGWSAPDPSADLGRTERQQVFMARAFSEVSGQAGSDPARIPGLVDALVGAVAIDESLSVRDLMGAAEALSGIGPEDLRTYSLPVVDREDGATVTMDDEPARPVLDHFRGVTTDPSDGSGSGASDGTGEDGEDGEDGEVHDQLPGQDEGDDRGGAGDANGDEDTTDGRPDETSNLVTDDFVRGDPPAGSSC